MAYVNVSKDISAPSSMKISGTGLAGAKVTFVLSVTPTDDAGSVATIDAEFISQMMVGAIGAAVERASIKELGISLDQLAELLA